MSDKDAKYKKRIETLENAKAQISKGYLQLEREKTFLRSALENLQLGFIMIDDYKKVIFKNIALDEILGPIDHGGWDVDKMKQLFKEKYDLESNIDNCFRKRVRIGPNDIDLNNSIVRIFISPVNIFVKSITVPAVVIVLENISGDKSGRGKK